ncbi:hypothetical protein QBC46DRAFT_380709 [Diplogelasinospora grovesii]|uniref:Uncharacterized protein n=1 Tax=Diplogelasinospora grovesii TaxID=303347 RepID=A0AAN6NCA5_9PEZI|nr:hypothetical protein QBC46DRAFT_380709 [Diplogelasinospora grovesii]
MQLPIIFFTILAGGALLANAQEQKTPSRLPYVVRKQLMSCEQTYGTGSVRCGDESSTFCYNPTLGQTCCKVDNGYCDAGTYCAPAAGYCCLEDEDLATCAKIAGFELPVNATLSDPAANSTSTTTTSFEQASVSATGPGVASGSGMLPGSTPSSSPFIQVSAAGRERWTLTRVTVGLGVIAVYMLSC